MTPCSVCQGPFHPATGHEFSESLRWCGPCTRDFIKFLKTQQGRRWGKLPFYEHATPPPAVSRFCECPACIKNGWYRPITDPRMAAPHYVVVPITHPTLATDKELRRDFAMAVIGPWLPKPEMECFWPCRDEREAEELARMLNAGDYVEPPEPEWTPGEMQRMLREISKKG